jgi:hypothetical protein
MQPNRKKEITQTEAEFFAGIHLNETENVEIFIQKLKNELNKFDPESKRKYLCYLIRRVNEEYSAHNTLCSLNKCLVKKYFMECLLRLEILCEVSRLN